MKKRVKNISSPEELDKNLQYSSPLAWIVLSLVLLILIGFFTWSFVYKLKVKLTGKADIASGVVTLHVDKNKLSELKVGQKVYISDQEGQILSFNDKEPVCSTFTLSDGQYDYYIMIEMRPIDYLFK